MNLWGAVQKSEAIKYSRGQQNLYDLYFDSEKYLLKISIQLSLYLTH